MHIIKLILPKVSVVINIIVAMFRKLAIIWSHIELLWTDYTLISIHNKTEKKRVQQIIVCFLYRFCMVHGLLFNMHMLINMPFMITVTEIIQVSFQHKI